MRWHPWLYRYTWFVSEHHFVFKIYLCFIRVTRAKIKEMFIILRIKFQRHCIAGIYMFNTGKLHIYHTTGIYVIDEKIGFDFCRSLIWIPNALFKFYLNFWGWKLGFFRCSFAYEWEDSRTAEFWVSNSLKALLIQIRVYR